MTGWPTGIQPGSTPDAPALRCGPTPQAASRHSLWCHLTVARTRAATRAQFVRPNALRRPGASRPARARR
eukprot:9271421-Alexandrium_andersonii.AAC.1